MHAQTHPTPSSEIVVDASGLRKDFRRSDGSRVRALDDVSLSVAPGEFVVLLGPSGCGKTTLLRSVAGLEHPDTGRIEIHAKCMFDSKRGIYVPPERRHIAMIFQSYALWPHMTAFKNVAYPLQARRIKRREIAERVSHAFELVGIPDLQGQYPSQMSGGQQQRVALARALVSNAGLILFDEPLSNVDAKVREQLRLELLSMQRRLGFAAIYVTHDQTEAMELAHRVAVMFDGRIWQVGTPREIYDQPLSREVAKFVGSANEIVGKVTATTNGGATIETSLGSIVGRVCASGSLAVGEQAVALFRPERVRVRNGTGDYRNAWKGRVLATSFLGPTVEHLVGVRDEVFRVWSDEGLAADGASLSVYVDESNIRILAA